MSSPIRIAILADADKAQAELRETARDAERVGDASDRAALDVERARQREVIAARGLAAQEAKLTAARQDGNMTAEEVVRVEDRVLKARERHATAVINLTDAQERHRASLDRTTDSSDRLGRSLGRLDDMLARIGHRAPDIDRVTASLGRMSASSAKVTAIVSGVTAAVVGLGGALAPVAAAATAVAGALGAVGMGAAAYTALVAPAFGGVSEAVQEATKAQEAYDAALAAGDTEAAAAALERLNAAFDGLTADQRALAQETIKFKDAWREASEEFSGPTMQAATRGLETLRDTIPTILKVATPVQDELIAQFDRLRQAVESPAFERFTDRLASNVRPAIAATSDIVADLGMTFGHVVDSALETSPAYLGVFQSITASLREAASGPQLAQFFEDALPAAQQMGKAVEAIGGMFGALLKGALPAADELFGLIETIARTLEKQFSGENMDRLVGGLGKAFKAAGGLIEAVLPHVIAIAGTLAEQLGPTIEALTPGVEAFAGGIAAILDALGPLLPVLGEVISAAVEGLMPALEVLAPALADALLPVLNTLATEVLPQVAPHIVTLVEAIVPLLPQLSEIVVQVVQLIPSIAGLVASIVEWYSSTGSIQEALKLLLELVSALVPTIQGALQLLEGIFRGDWSMAWDGAAKMAEGAWRTIIAAAKVGVNSVLGPLRLLPGSLGEPFRSGWTAAMDVTSRAWASMRSTVSQSVQAVVGFVRQLPQMIRDLFANAWQWLQQAGESIINGLLAGIQRGVDRVRSVLRNLTDMIPAWKGPAERDRTLLSDAGRLIMDGLVDALAAGKDGVRRQLGEVTDLVQSGLDGILSPTIEPQLSLAGISGGDLGRFGGQAPPQVNVTVVAPVGSSPADIGRELAIYLDHYRSAGGRV